MAEKPSYKLAHDARKGTGEMTIEAVKPYVRPHSEEIPPVEKPGAGPGMSYETPSLSPEENAKSGSKAEPAITHPGQYSKPGSDLSKT
jgi:hypothetical protein